MMATMTAQGRFLITGSGRGEVLFSHTGLSFWGGVDGASGEIIDYHHPLQGRSLAGKALAIPSGRGSCTGSSVLLELILNGHGPAALLLAEADEILALGVLVARQLFARDLPVITLDKETFGQLATCRRVEINDYRLRAFGHDGLCFLDIPLARPETGLFVLSDEDRAMLAGDMGEAVRRAMEIVVYMAQLQQAVGLISVSQVHIDGCIYTGGASLSFARQWLAWGGRVRVPTTLNAVSVDCRRWREQGIDPKEGEPAGQLADAYLQLGATGSFTCAPYLLATAPRAGEHIAWSESNAVSFANSVLAARTQKYPDFLDLCIALTGRAPLSGPHLDASRHAEVQIDVPLPAEADDSLYPLLGHLVGELSPNHIPVVCGLEPSGMSRDDLKAFSAAFATTSAAPMFHIVGVTPEATALADALGNRPPVRHYRLTSTDLLSAWQALNTAVDSGVQLVALGNPHLSLTEYARLAQLCRGGHRHPDVALVLTSGREVYRQAEEAGYVATLESFGAQCINDTCWCMLRRPVVPVFAATLMTNSGKYAHYAPGLVDCRVHFASLADCIAAARLGYADLRPPRWLMPFVDTSGGTADGSTDGVVKGAINAVANGAADGSANFTADISTSGSTNGTIHDETGGTIIDARHGATGGSLTDV
ncbi:aconitase family protein [Sodalis sp. dw_96]|uniref:cis-3-hydroxy-L-proline dehydratase n=1 Tax=Sodalis sp. dw_96 TaxID=2719794 RepID=UPI001BD487AD|nr:aconitase family protein [Sodalis sp. dw_96]